MKKFNVGDKTHVDYLQYVGAEKPEDKSVIGIIVEISRDGGFAIVKHKSFDGSGEIVFTAIPIEKLY